MATATSPFATKASSSDGGDFELPPSGTHPAVLIGLIDLGTHEREFNGEKNDVHKLLLIWELTGEHDSKGDPFVVAKDFTWSLNKKAKLRGFVEGYAGRALIDGEEYDLGLMLGQPCMINLTEGTSGKGNKFVDVSSISKPMKGLTVPPTDKQTFALVLSMLTSLKDDWAIPEWVPKLYGRKVEDDIKASREYLKLSPF